MARRNRSMCVKIARDVLAQLRLNRFQATQGTYVSVNLGLEDGSDFWSSEYHEARRSSFKTYFKNNQQATCDVCALGAAFISMVNIENKCSVEGVMNEEGMWERLEEYFGATNMNLMESAFECQAMDHVYDEDRNEWIIDVAVEWGEQYKESTERMQAIMRNVIRNNGDFKLPQKFLSKARRLEREERRRDRQYEIALD